MSRVVLPALGDRTFHDAATDRHRSTVVHLMSPARPSPGRPTSTIGGRRRHHIYDFYRDSSSRASLAAVSASARSRATPLRTERLSKLTSQR
jgi:hypothetical protein